ncbi:MAG: hypothetical protein SFV53_03295 [Rickettsiales bacterium]|nr:hypothetical protein [Rickettsiales bacterium]
MKSSALTKAFQSFLRYGSKIENKHAWKPTIAIVGFKPSLVAELNKEIVNYGNSIGLDDDQYFPEIFSIEDRKDNTNSNLKLYNA